MKGIVVFTFGKLLMWGGVELAKHCFVPLFFFLFLLAKLLIRPTISLVLYSDSLLLSVSYNLERQEVVVVVGEVTK